uniref:Uncharacterized protein n=1 Tax=Anguilla anguilla TaxID=7936 RepID=A0A0E9UD57_ANGAN
MFRKYLAVWKPLPYTSALKQRNDFPPLLLL